MRDMFKRMLKIFSTFNPFAMQKIYLDNYPSGKDALKRDWEKITVYQYFLMNSLMKRIVIIILINSIL